MYARVFLVAINYFHPSLMFVNNADFVRLIDILSLQNRLLKVCYASATSTRLPMLLFLLRPLTELTKQTRQVVCAVKQSIFLRCLWLGSTIGVSSLPRPQTLTEGRSGLRCKLTSLQQRSIGLL